MQLSIIILNFNKKDLILSCIKSIYAVIQTVEFEIIVFDNASTDNSLEAIKTMYPQVKLFESKINLGFGSAINHAATYAKGNYLLFLNNDTLVISENIKHMMQLYEENKHIGIIGGLLSNTDDTPQRSYSKFYNLTQLFITLYFGERFEDYKNTTFKKVNWVTGACMLIKKSIFDEVHGFDKNLFMYIEDMELCWRLNKIGYSTYFSPELKVKHKGQGSANRDFAIKHFYKNVLYFYSKHKNSVEYSIAKSLLFIKAYLTILIGFITGNKVLVNRYLSAIRF